MSNYYTNNKLYNLITGKRYGSFFKNKIYKIIDGDAHKLPEGFKGLFYDNSCNQLIYWMYCYMNTIGQKYGCPYVNVSFNNVKDKFVQEV